jgi:hypothetical protein
MNVFARLIDPSLPVPQPSVMQGRVHILADEIDNTTLLPASKPGPKPRPPVGPLGEVKGLPRLEVQYERDESVCMVAANGRTQIAEAWFPVVRWVPTEPTPATGKYERAPKAAPVLADASIQEGPTSRKLAPPPGPGPGAYRVAR